MNTSLRTLQINLEIKKIEGWDSNFSKDDFMEGAKNAAVTISLMLQQSNWKELRGLLIREAVKTHTKKLPIKSIVCDHIAVGGGNVF